MLVEQIDRLEEAIGRDGCHTLGDVLDMIQRGDVQLWETKGAVLVTEIHRYPRSSVLHFWLAAGELDEVVALSHVAMAWGREQGCQRATLAGRRGWERALAGEGWSAEATLMGRTLNDGEA